MLFINLIRINEYKLNAKKNKVMHLRAIKIWKVIFNNNYKYNFKNNYDSLLKKNVYKLKN